MVGLCRLCASLRKTDALITIKNDSNEICQKLRKCCQLIIDDEDALPKSVCQECLENLNISHKFYIKVQEAQETLQALFPSNSSEDKSENESNAALVQTLAAAVGQDKKRKFSVIEQEQSPINQTIVDKNDKENEKTKKRKQEIPTKIVKAEFIPKVLKNQDEGGYDENVLESLDSTGNEKYLDEVYSLLDISKEEVVVENANKILSKSEPLEIIEEGPIFEHDHIETHSEEQRLEEHYLLDDNNAEESLIEILVHDLATEGETVVTQNVVYNRTMDLELQNIEDVIEEHDEEMETEINEILDKPDTTLTSHEQIKSWKSYTYLCINCKYKAVSLEDLRTHYENVHEIYKIYKFKCYDCKKNIPRYNSFLNHIRSKHHPALKLQCDICDLTCENYEKLSFHRNFDCTEANVFESLMPCTKCFKSFHNAYGLQNHIKLQHSSLRAKETYQCTHCGKEFKKKNFLKVHEALHTDPKSFFCGICDSKFSNKNSLDHHLYIHIDEKYYTCNICDKSFKTFLTLDQHQIVHSDLKPFKCDYCDKTFRKKVEKISHERVHTGEMPFKCNHCDKRFRYLSALNSHTRSHLNIRPYECDYCDKIFTDVSNRNKHVKRKHANDAKKENDLNK